MKPEQKVQKDIKAAAGALGFSIYELDQGYRPPACPECGAGLGRGAGGTRQTKGLSDVYLVHRPKEFRVWVEVKAGANRPTDAQAAFLVQIRNSGGDAFPAWNTADFCWGLRAAGFRIDQLPPWQETSKRFRDWIPCLYPYFSYPWEETTSAEETNHG